MLRMVATPAPLSKLERTQAAMIDRWPIGDTLQGPLCCFPVEQGAYKRHESDENLGWKHRKSTLLLPVVWSRVLRVRAETVPRN